MGWRGMDTKELEYLASQGYVCFDIDYRLFDVKMLNAQAESGPNMVQGILQYTSGPAYLTGPYTIGDMVKDIGNFTYFISAPGNNKYGADLTKVVLLGQSAGSYLAGIVGYGYNNPWFGANFSTALTIKGMILHYPPNNASQFFYYDHPMFHSDTFSIIPGTPDTNPDAYYHYTPSNLVDSNCPPTLILQGAVDKMVPPENAYTIYTQLINHDRKAIELVAPFGGHAFDFAPHYQAISIYYTERFLYLILN